MESEKTLCAADLASISFFLSFPVARSSPVRWLIWFQQEMPVNEGNDIDEEGLRLGLYVFPTQYIEYRVT